mgnify:FL=1
MYTPWKDGWEKTIDALTANSPTFVRITVVAGKSFFYYHAPTRAAALTYTTFLAAVPLFILLTSIVLHIGFGSLLSDYLPLLEEISTIRWPIEEIRPILENAEHIPAGKLGLVGSLSLFVTFLLAIGSLEINFNVVWEKKVSRSLLKQFLVYSPILLVLAAIIGLFASFAQNVHDILEMFLIQGFHFDSGTFYALQTLFWIGAFIATAYIIIFLILFALPSRSDTYSKKKLIWSSLLTSGISLGAIYIYINILSHIQTTLFARLSLFYGSLAFIPLLLFLVIGIWIIILFANSLVWTICNWPEAEKKIWNWSINEHIL